MGFIFDDGLKFDSQINSVLKAWFFFQLCLLSKARSFLSLKGVLLCFKKFSQCVVCMFGHKTTYKVVFLYLWYHKDKSRLQKFDWLAGGENDWLSTARFQNRYPCGCFYITISHGNQLSSVHFACHFHFILHIMSDKATFVSRAVLCTALPGEPWSLLQQRLRWQRMYLQVYAITNSVSLGLWYK